MKIFIDTEFYEYQPPGLPELQTRTVGSKFWGLMFDQHPVRISTKPQPGANAIQLISIGAVREDGVKFYAENSEFDWLNVPADHWLQENVRPHLFNERISRGVPMWLDDDRPQGGYYLASDLASRFHEFVGPEPEFWGYYADYDWVVLCGLYGRMVDLPQGWPMYCRDVKQLVDERGGKLPPKPKQAHHALADAQWTREAYLDLMGMR